MEKFVNKVEMYIDKYDMLYGVSHVVAGISGGADSVCLLSVLNELALKYDFEIIAVHVNHMIRGEEADSDERYAASLCSEMGVRFEAVHIDVVSKAKQQKITVEEAGRNARYKTFEEIRRKLMDRHDCKKAVIAVAHNQNDNAETIIFNMIRGSGPDGIKGISPVRDNIIRPLLCAKRLEIEEYLNQKGISYCIDSTNNDDLYTRNKIRHMVIPAMEAINVRAVEHMGQLAESITGYLDYINKIVKKYIDDNVTIYMESDGRYVWCIDIALISSEDSMLEKKVIKTLIEKACGGGRDIGISHVNEVRKLYNTASGSYIMLPHGAKVKHTYEKLEFVSCFSIEEQRAAINIEINKNADGIYELPDGKGIFSVKIYDRPSKLDLSKKEYTKCLDYDKIRDNVLLRCFRDGDYMVIDADSSRKKLNRLFSSYKIPIERRKQILLVATGQEIIWAVGLRISEAYKVDDNTKRIIEMEYKIV